MKVWKGEKVIVWKVEGMKTWKFDNCECVKLWNCEWVKLWKCEGILVCENVKERKCKGFFYCPMGSKDVKQACWANRGSMGPLASSQGPIYFWPAVTNAQTHKQIEKAMIERICLFLVFFWNFASVWAGSLSIHVTISPVVKVDPSVLLTSLRKWWLK